MTAEAVYLRLRVTDPSQWHALAAAWRQWATLVAHLTAELPPLLTRVAAAWSGMAAAAAADRIGRLRRGLVVFRLLCWQADQAISEFAAALDRARALLTEARAAAARGGLAIADDGTVRGGPAIANAGTTPSAPAIAAMHSGPTTARSAPTIAAAHGGPAITNTDTMRNGAAIAAAQSDPAITNTGTMRNGAAIAAADTLRGSPGGAVTPDFSADPWAALSAALSIAERADTEAASRLGTLAREPARPPGPRRPACTAGPIEVRRWWCGLTAGEQRWLLATEPGWLAPLDGIPAADRDAANRLLLDDRRAEIERAAATAHGHEAKRLRGLRHGLDALTDRLATEDGPRAYLLRLDSAEEGRVVVALGDPDRADNVLTHVPGMTSDLASFDGELTRAARVAGRATEVGPAASTSAVLWLDYDAPDFIDEAASTRQATAAAPTLRHFQDGLRATHQGTTAAHQTVVGHSYGSLVVGEAAAAGGSGSGLNADDVVFVGSPGVGVDSAAQLHVPPGHVWSSTSRSDVIQYAAVSPRGLADEASRVVGFPPGAGFAEPERHLWFGENPSDPAFGARVFASQPDGGHLGYWDPGRPALDALAAITLGRTP